MLMHYFPNLTAIEADPAALLPARDAIRTRRARQFRASVADNTEAAREMVREMGAVGAGLAVVLAPSDAVGREVGILKACYLISVGNTWREDNQSVRDGIQGSHRN